MEKSNQPIFLCPFRSFIWKKIRKWHAWVTFQKTWQLCTSWLPPWFIMLLNFSRLVHVSDWLLLAFFNLILMLIQDWIGFSSLCPLVHSGNLQHPLNFYNNENKKQYLWFQDHSQLLILCAVNLLFHTLSLLWSLSKTSSFRLTVRVAVYLWFYNNPRVL